MLLNDGDAYDLCDHRLLAGQNERANLAELTYLMTLQVIHTLEFTNAVRKAWRHQC